MIISFIIYQRKSVNIAKNNIKYIALYKSKNVFGEDAEIAYYGKVKEINVVQRKEIAEISKASDELYCSFYSLCDSPSWKMYIKI